MGSTTENLRLSDVRDMRRVSFQLVELKDKMYIADQEKTRMQKNKYRGNRNLDYYNKHLPAFKGQTFLDYLSETAINTAELVNVLDIGCGEGIALAQLQQRFPQVRTFGISATDMRTIEPSENIKPHVAAIDYRIGDIHRLIKMFPDVEFDYIISMRTFFHLGDPFAAIKQCYRLLKTRGIAFIEEPGFWLSVKELIALKQLWQSQGINAELHGLINRPIAEMQRLAQSSPTYAGMNANFDLSVEKSSARLPMPFQYANPRFPNPENPNSYTFKFG